MLGWSLKTLSISSEIIAPAEPTRILRRIIQNTEKIISMLKVLLPMSIEVKVTIKEKRIMAIALSAATTESKNELNLPLAFSS